MQLNLSNTEFEPDFLEVINMFFPVNEVHDDIIDIDYNIDEKIHCKIKVNEKEYQFVESLNEYQSQKTILKHLLYKALSDYKKVDLPWGCLTGIRPTKLCYDLLKKGVIC